MNIEEIKSKVAAIRWRHKIDLGNGIITPGMVDNAAKLNWLKLPQDLSGKTVLDIGAWDGFYSFEAERRGAQRVLATDSYIWELKDWGSKGFNLAREVLSSNVEDKTIDVMDISPEQVGMFDIVLFLGVLYHMRHPLLALERVFSVTKEIAIIETAMDMLEQDRPAMALYPGRELADDFSNWVGPNPAGVRALLLMAGFKRIECIYQSPVNFAAEGKPGGRAEKSDKYHIPVSRGVFHAWRN